MSQTVPIYYLTIIDNPQTVPGFEETGPEDAPWARITMIGRVHLFGVELRVEGYAMENDREMGQIGAHEWGEDYMAAMGNELGFCSAAFQTMEWNGREYALTMVPSEMRQEGKEWGGGEVAA